MHHRKKSDCELIEAKFVKHQSTFRLVHATLQVYHQFPVILFSVVSVTEEKYYKTKTKTYKM